MGVISGLSAQTIRCSALPSQAYFRHMLLRANHMRTPHTEAHLSALCQEGDIKSHLRWSS